MTHRKPLGSTTGWMVFDWEGAKPKLGDYLVSGAGTWYRIVGLEEKRNPAKVGLMLERIAGPDAVAAVHEFYWARRDRRREA